MKAGQPHETVSFSLPSTIRIQFGAVGGDCGTAYTESDHMIVPFGYTAPSLM